MHCDLFFPLLLLYMPVLMDVSYFFSFPLEDKKLVQMQ